MKGFKDMAIGTLDIDKKIVVEAVFCIVQTQSNFTEDRIWVSLVKRKVNSDFFRKYTKY